MIRVENARKSHKELLSEANTIWQARYSCPGEQLVDFALREHADFMAAYHCVVALMSHGEYNCVAFSKYITWLEKNNWGSSEEKFLEAQAEYSALLRSSRETNKARRKKVYEETRKETYESLLQAHEESRAAHDATKKDIAETEARLLAENRGETRKFYEAVGRSMQDDPVCHVVADEHREYHAPPIMTSAPAFTAMDQLLA